MTGYLGGKKIMEEDLSLGFREEKKRDNIYTAIPQVSAPLNIDSFRE